MPRYFLHQFLEWRRLLLASGGMILASAIWGWGSRETAVPSGVNGVPGAVISVSFAAGGVVAGWYGFRLKALAPEQQE